MERFCGQLPFPKGAFSLAYARQIEVLIRMEAGQLRRATDAAIELATLGEQHGFDSWALVGAAQHATVSAVSVAGRKRRGRIGVGATHRDDDGILGCSGALSV